MLIFIIVSLCIIVLYRHASKNHDYWKLRNIKHDRPLPFFGNHWKNLIIRRSLVETCVEMLNKFKGEKIVGYYRGTITELIIKDLNIVKHILRVDSKNFPGKWWNDNIQKEPLLHSMIFLNDDQSRPMRQQQSRGFTPSKLRNMSHRVLTCTERIEQTVAGIASQGEAVAAYDLMVEYSLQCAGACGFGVQLDDIPNWTLFKNCMLKFFDQSKPQQFLTESLDLFPELKCLFTNVKFVDKNLEKMVMMITKTVSDERKLNPAAVNDFLDIALDMAAQKNHDDGLNEAHREKAKLQYTAAQVFLFLAAGFETTATAMSVALHQLAYHPEIQLEIQKEIDSVLAKHENKLMESLNDMTLLEMVIKESMRMFSPVGVIRRVCADTYTLPGTDVTIDRGVRILIPLQAIHNDPEIYEHPEEFRPERFANAEEKDADFKYMIFGDGPKKCLGYKLAMMMVSAGLAAILRRFSVQPAETSKRLLQGKKTSFLVQLVDGGIPLKFIPRE